MTSKHQNANTIAVPAFQNTQTGPVVSKDTAPPFRALGMPALTAATRNTSMAKPIKAQHELPHFMRNPQNS